MKAYLTSRRLAFASGAAVLLAALTLGGVAQAVTDSIFRYTTAKTGYFNISFMAMAPSTNVAADDYSSNWGQGYITGGFGCFQTGVNLPNGARITQLSVWTTSGAVSNPLVRLLRHRSSDGALYLLVNQVFGDDSNVRKQYNAAIPNNHFAVVDNTNFAYGFGVCVESSDDLFHGARITYTYTNAGD